MAEAQIKITADTQQATTDINRLDSALGKLKPSSDTVEKVFNRLSVVAAGVGYAMSRVVASTGELNDTANILGISASNLNALQKAAQQAGVGAEQLTASMFKLNQNLGDALVKGSGPANDALKRLGLNAQQLSQQSLDKTFQDVTKALAGIENPALRASTAVDLFGKTGAKVVEVTQAAEAFRKKMEDLGLALSDLDVSAIDAVGDSFAELNSVIEAGFQKALSALAPYLISFARTVEQVVGHIVRNWDSILPVLKVVGIALAALAVYFSPILVGIGLVTAAVLKWPKVFGAVAQFILDTISFILTPLTFLVKQILAVKAAMEATAQGKNPFEAYNRALKEGITIFGDVKTIQTEINAGAEKEKAAREATKGVITGINEEQKKALESLEKSVEAQKISNDYLKNRLAYGDEEAKKMKLVDELNQKIKESKIAITPEVTRQLDILRNTAKEEANTTQSLERQLGLRQATRSLIEGFANQLQPGEEIVQQIENLQRAAQGLDIKVPIKIETREQERALAEAAIPVAQRRAAEMADATIAQYSKIYGEAYQITNDYNKATRELDVALQQARAAGGDQEIARVQAIEEAKLSIVENRTRRELEMEINKFTKIGQLQDLQFKAQAVKNVEAHRNDKDLLGNQLYSQQQLEDAVQKQTEFAKKSEMEKTQFAIGQAATMFNALGAHNKKAFEAAKAFNIASAIMNTFVGASKALIDYPPPFSYLAVAAQVALGMAQVAQIRAQTYSGRALGGPMVGGQGYLVGERGPEIFRPSTAGSMTPNDQLVGGGATNITFNIVANDTKGFDQLLVERRPLITKIIADAQLERGRRQL